MHIQSCPTLCNPMDGSLPGFSVHGIFQARILEWVAIIFSRGSSRLRDWTHVSCIGRQILYHWATEEVAVITGMLRVWGRDVIEDDMHDWIGMERSFLHLWKGYFNNFVKWLYNRIYILICVGHILFMTCPPTEGQNSLWEKVEGCLCVSSVSFISLCLFFLIHSPKCFMLAMYHLQILFWLTNIVNRFLFMTTYGF